MKRHVFYIILAFVLTSCLPVMAQFLVDDDDKVDIIFNEKKTRISKEFFKGRYPSYLPFNMEAYKSPEMPSTVVIRWEADKRYTGDFVVGRYSKPVQSAEDALASSTVRILPSSINGLVVDGPLPPGTYYYVVLPKRYLLKRKIELYKGMNTTVEPVIITKKDAATSPVFVRNIQVQQVDGNRVKVTWKEPRERNHGFIVYRHSEVLDRQEAFKKATRRGMVIDKNYLFDRLNKDGTYYYAVVMIKSGREFFHMVPGENFTATPFIKGERKVENRIRVVRLIGVRNNDSIILKWIHAGTVGTRDFLLFKSRDRFCRPSELTKDDVIATVRVDKGSFVVEKVSRKRGWYGLVPKNYSGTGCIMKPDQNMVLIEELPEQAKASNPGLVDEKQRFAQSQRDITSKKDAKTVLNDQKKETAQIVIRPKMLKGDTTPDNNRAQSKKEVKTEEDPLVVTDKPVDNNLDGLLSRTFYRGQYRQGITDLQNFIKGTDNNRERARARLFLGRSYIELHDYRKAFTILSMPDVGREFPREQAFWKDYAIREINR